MKDINEIPVSKLIKIPLAFAMVIAAKVYRMSADLYNYTLAYETYYKFDTKRGVHMFLICDPMSDGECGTDLKIEILDSTGNYRWCKQYFACAAISGKAENIQYPWEYTLPVVPRKSNRSSRKHGKYRLLNVWE